MSASDYYFKIETRRHTHPNIFFRYKADLDRPPRFYHHPFNGRERQQRFLRLSFQLKQLLLWV